MPQSLANILVHLVFSTKHRERLLHDDFRPSLHAYIGGILSNEKSPGLAINSVEDHIHILLALGRTTAISQLVESVKTGSTKWIKREHPALRGFHWQNGYGAFSISPSHVVAVSAYIAAQREHHARVSFQDELRRLCGKYNVTLDEHYAWD